MPAAESLFRGLFGVTVAGLSGMQAAGVVRPAADLRALAAFLLANDLALVVLREQIAAVLGADPFSEPGLRRWSEVLLDAYGRGLLQVPREGTEG